MKILAFDASGQKAGVAVSIDGRVAAGRESAAPGRKDDLHVHLEAALREARLRPSDLDAVSVGLGPGSFTGLRIAVAAANGLAWSAGLDLFGFSTLEAIAVARGDSPARIVMPAGRGNVYTAGYSEARGGWRVLQKPRLETASSQRLTPPVDAVRIAEALARLADASPRKTCDPFRLEPLYLYPRDCNVTTA